MLLPLIHLSPEGATLSQSALATGRGAKHLGAAGAEDDSLLKRHRGRIEDESESFSVEKSHTCACEKIVVMWKHPGHLTSMKKLLGD